MIHNDSGGILLLDRARHSRANLANALPVGHIEAHDVSKAVAWLVFPAARYVTGVSLPVDDGFSVL